MAYGRVGDADVRQLKKIVSSFGFTVVARGVRIFVIWPGAQEVYICRKLPRLGFWELNKVDRNLWELHGALGIHVFAYIGVQELIRWFYELALQTPTIMEGLHMTAKNAGNLIRHADRNKPQTQTKATKRKRNTRLQEEEDRDRKRQDDIRDKTAQPRPTTKPKQKRRWPSRFDD